MLLTKSAIFCSKRLVYEQNIPIFANSINTRDYG
nr:MAG TPA: hypothetical protein [Caudoviricetes sp.]